MIKIKFGPDLFHAYAAVNIDGVLYDRGDQAYQSVLGPHAKNKIVNTQYRALRKIMADGINLIIDENGVTTIAPESKNMNDQIRNNAGNITISFDRTSFCQVADVAINGKHQGDGDDACEAIKDRRITTTRRQDDILKAIQAHGVELTVDVNGKITGRIPVVATPAKINHCDMGHQTNAQVRRLPTGGGGADILCRVCYDREIKRRKKINHHLDANKFETPEWDDLEDYDPIAP